MVSSRSAPAPDLPRSAPAMEPLSVDAALLTLTPKFTAERPVTVAGKVHGVRTAGRWHYVDLGGNQAKLTLRLPSSTPAPNMGQQIVVYGTLSVAPSEFHGGLEAFLTGAIQGTYRTQSLPGSGRPLERAHEPTRLSRLLGGEYLPNLVVIATATGWEDARRAAGAAAQHLPWKRLEGNFADPGRMIALLREVGDRGDGDAVAVLRGGGDARSLDLWEDPDIVEALLLLGRPFFTALGHSTNVLLADRYADESFDTPTAFGNAVGQLVEDRRVAARRIDALRGQRDSLAGQVSQAEAELSRVREQLAHAQADAGAKQRLAVIVIGILVVAFLLALVLL